MLTDRRWRRWSARRAARLTLSVNEVGPVPAECLFSAPTFTSRARDARALRATNAVTEMADGPAGVVTLPRTTAPSWRRATFTEGGVSSPPPGCPPGGPVSVPVGGGPVVPVGGGAFGSGTSTLPVIKEPCRLQWKA